MGASAEAVSNPAVEASLRLASDKASWAASSRSSADGLQYGCGKASPVCSASPHVLPAKQPFLESRRAESNRLPLLQLRVITQAL